LIKCLAFHDHQQWKIYEICAREKKNISEKRKKNEGHLREKERKSLILKLAQQVTKSIFYKIK